MSPVAEVFEAYRERLAARARRTLRSDAEADDVVQEVMPDILEAPTARPTVRNTVGWLDTPVRHGCVGPVRGPAPQGPGGAPRHRVEPTSRGGDNRCAKRTEGSRLGALLQDAEGGTAARPHLRRMPATRGGDVASTVPPVSDFGLSRASGGVK